MEDTAPDYPLFIVGLPRSGTKLLRALLDNHPQIRIAPFETHFLPAWANSWKRYGDLSDFRNFRNFYREAVKLPYFQYIKQRQTLIDAAQWHRFCPNYTIAGVFEALVRHDVGTLPGKRLIWGDKTPSYVRHLALLKSLFPQARLVHIIRDVRDQALSVNRTWGKNPYRAAQQWNDAIIEARNQVRDISSAYIEIRYEDLVAAPEKELMTICSFLGIEYEPEMTNLTHSVESQGGAKGRKFIMSSNIHKYRTQMPARMRRKIESIAGETARELNYDIDRSVEPHRLPAAAMRAYQIMDGLHLVNSNIREKGLRFAATYIAGSLRLHRDS